MAEQEIQKLVNDLKFSKVQGSLDAAVRTAEVLRKVVKSVPKKNFRCEEVLEKIEEAGVRILRARPIFLSIENTTKSILKIVREGFEGEREVPAMVRNFASLVQATPPAEGEDEDTKVEITSSIKEHIKELKANSKAIAEKLYTQIKEGCVIMTSGYSTTLCEAFESAVKDGLKFHVIVVEHAPSFDGHDMIEYLRGLEIETTLITDVEIFAVMPRVNLVFLDAHAVLGDGSIVIQGGGSAIALSAAEFGVNVLITSGIHKLSAEFALDSLTYNEVENPRNIIPYNQSGDKFEDIDVQCYKYEIVHPEKITLIYTSIGPTSPWYIYRVLSEVYDPRDKYDLHRKSVQEKE